MRYAKFFICPCFVIISFFFSLFCLSMMIDNLMIFSVIKMNLEIERILSFAFVLVPLFLFTIKTRLQNMKTIMSQNITDYTLHFSPLKEHN